MSFGLSNFIASQYHVQHSLIEVLYLLTCHAENVFSSLVGLQFVWKLMPESDETPHHLLHVPLKDSPLSDCGGLCGFLNIQKNLENNVRRLQVTDCWLFLSWPLNS